MLCAICDSNKVNISERDTDTTVTIINKRLEISTRNKTSEHNR